VIPVVSGPRPAGERTGLLRGLTAAGFVCCLALLVGCSTGGSPNSGVAFVAGDGAVTVVPAGRRQAPVDLDSRTLDGQEFRLATTRGNVVVINVWGSWCAPCRKEAPALERAYESLRGSAVRFVGIDTRDGAAQARAFVRTFGIAYPSLPDDDGALLLALRGAVPPSAIPTTLVLDRSGRVAARVSGPVDTSTLVGLVRDRLAEPPAAGG